MFQKIIARFTVCLLLSLLVLSPLSSAKALAADTKVVSVVETHTFVAASNELGQLLSDYSNSHYYYDYDDGSYRGTITMGSYGLQSQTLYNPNTNTYIYVFWFRYAGVVTAY